MMPLYQLRVLISAENINKLELSRLRISRHLAWNPIEPTPPGQRQTKNSVLFDFAINTSIFLMQSFCDQIYSAQKGIRLKGYRPGFLGKIDLWRSDLDRLNLLIDCEDSAVLTRFRIRIGRLHC